MDHLRLLRDIEMKKFKPVYLLMGEEPYFIDVVTDAIEDKALDEASKAFGQTIVYGRDVSMEQIVGLAKSFPMMGDRQVVIVKEAQDMSDWRKTAGDDDEAKIETKKVKGQKVTEPLKFLEHYLSNLTPSTILVFAYKGKLLDKRLKVYNKFKEVAEIFTSNTLKDGALVNWINGYVTQTGLKIDPGASILLAEYLGNDLSKIVNEVSKLAIALLKGTTITTKHIEENIGISKDYNIWELHKCIGQKNIEKANRIIHYFESNPKAHPIQMLIPSLYSFFTRCAIYHAIPDKSNAASEMGISPFALPDYREATKNYNSKKVERIMTSLRKADKQVKGIDSGQITDGEIMKELLFRILH